ncbi:MAG: VWA domain-containing protein [Bacteroidaceae bacterium]|nr:VWA domain-containing protein [Bacteroidaceae bacterium]
MFRFANPEYLYLLTVLPLLVLLFGLNRKAGRKRLLRLGKAEYVRRLMAEVSETRVWIKFALLIGALAIVVLILARPQMGMRMKTDTVSGIEVVVAMDVSNSMMADDVEPNRLTKAKQVVSSLCSRLKNDKVALVVFAGNAFLQMPMSADNVSVKMFLDAINTGMIPTQGTSIAEALKISNNSFSAQKDVKRAVVVITDGEDHEGGVEDALSELKKKGANVYVLGIGSTKGATIKNGNDYLRDIDGNIVVTRLNESMCQQIAKAANGNYIHVDNSNSAQDQLVDELNHLQRSELNGSAYEEYNDLFPWLAIVALVLLAIEVVVQPRKSHYFDSWNLFSVKTGTHKAMLLLLMMTMSIAASGQSATKIQTHKGNISFTKKLDSLAVIHYQKAIALDSTNFKAHYNLGNTYLRQGKAQDALREYEKSAALSPSRLVKAGIYHNIGVINQTAQQFDQAIDAYKKSLRAYPNDDRTRYNLALCQHQRKKNPNQQPNQQQNKDDKQGQDKDKKDQQQQNQQQDKDQQKQQQQQQMSKQNVEQMLRAVQMRERETQDKLKRKMQPAGRRHLEKNW